MTEPSLADSQSQSLTKPSHIIPLGFPETGYRQGGDERRTAFGDHEQVRGRALPPTISTIPGAILVIDDDLAIREALIDILGFITTAKVHGAANGHEGLQFFHPEKKNIVLIFLDMNMPIMNGEETYIQLQQIAPEVKVIIASSLSHAETQHRLGQKRPSAFLPKPFSIDLLVQTLLMVFAMP
ncbi:MAG: response regulator [Chloroflexi bacterium]|nr:response regulator [Chloroflexota bacterium]